MPTNSKLKRDKRIAFAKKYAARLVNFKNRMANYARKLGAGNKNPATDMRQKLISGMTNWQRTQWHRAVSQGKIFNTQNSSFGADSLQGVQYYANADRKTREVRIEGLVIGHV